MSGYTGFLYERTRRTAIDINTVLTALNIFVAALIAYAMPYAANNPYVDQETMQLGLLLSPADACCAVLREEAHDPFVILFAFTTILLFLSAALHACAVSVLRVVSEVLLTGLPTRILD